MRDGSPASRLVLRRQGYRGEARRHYTPSRSGHALEEDVMTGRRIASTLALGTLAAGALTTGAFGQDGAPKADAHGFLPVAADPPLAQDTSGKYGGTLVFAEPGELASFNPIIVSDQTSVDVYQLSFDSMCAYDNANPGMSSEGYRPSLAVKWEHS